MEGAYSLASHANITHMNDFNFLIAVGIFISYVLVDGMYAYYTLAVVDKRPFISATIGALMHFLIALGVLSYVQNYLYIIPLAMGSWLGTFWVLKKYPDPVTKD